MSRGPRAWTRRALAASAGWSGVALAAPCDVDGVPDAIAAAEARVRADDVLGFEREVARLREEIACLREPVRPEVASSVHLTLGLWHWSHREDELALASIRAARLADPDRALPDALFPVGDPLRLAFEGAFAAEPWVPVRVPASRALWFDGVASRSRPTDRPTLVQVGGPDGVPQVSRVIAPTEPVPSPPWVGRTRRDLGITAATTAAVAAGLYGGAWAAHAQFQQHAIDDLPGLERDRALSNGLAVSSLVAALVAVGTGVTAAALR